MISRTERLRNMAAVCLESAAAAEKYGLPHQKKQDIAHYNALAAALLAGAEALERTTPEPISEKHKDGRWWWCWAPRHGWHTNCWLRGAGEWAGYADQVGEYTPTHALPMPPSPTPEVQDLAGQGGGE